MLGLPRKGRDFGHGNGRRTIPSHLRQTPPHRPVRAIDIHAGWAAEVTAAPSGSVGACAGTGAPRQATRTTPLKGSDSPEHDTDGGWARPAHAGSRRNPPSESPSPSQTTPSRAVRVPDQASLPPMARADGPAVRAKRPDHLRMSHESLPLLAVIVSIGPTTGRRLSITAAPTGDAVLRSPD